MAINTVWAEILYEKKEIYDYRGNLLTLGRQEIDITADSVKQKYKTSGACAEPESFFNFLGFSSSRSIDISRKDEADIIHDLNTKIPDELKQEFDFVIDGGTMEHLFNIGVVMTSIVEMLQVGGTVIHLNQTQGYCNHGFYNFQPTFYYSFYQANHFNNMECLIVEYLNQEKTEVRVIGVPNYNNMNFHSPNNCLIMFKAVKQEDIHTVKFPNQEFYHNIFKEKKKVNGAMIKDSLYQRIVGNVPGNSYQELIKNSYLISL
jgi:hypothetical protein